MSLRGANGGMARKRLISPAALVLTLICFAFPFITVSCESPLGSFSASFSGYALSLGLQPSVDGITPFEGGSDSPEIPESVGVQPLVAVALLLVISGALAVLISSSRVRAIITAASAAAAALLLIVNQVAMSREAVKALIKEDVPANYAGQLVRNDYGFWLSVVLLVLTAGYSGFELFRGRFASLAPKRHQPPAPPPAYDA